MTRIHILSASEVSWVVNRCCMRSVTPGLASCCLSRVRSAPPRRTIEELDEPPSVVWAETWVIAANMATAARVYLANAFIFRGYVLFFTFSVYDYLYRGEISGDAVGADRLHP